MCSKRGLQDIENETVFQSNQEFVFRDSRGSEAAGESEFNQEARLKDQLRALW
ncbi:hypothetical protein EDD22DRAFT_787800 [Suillus occidentalis]|nr:hypothetical protein EDD22DRAFT_787800 [Suillus occidentalis]